MASLQEELESLQKKLTRRLRLQAILNSTLAIILVLVVLSILDYEFRPELSIIRFSLSILFWVAVSATLLFILLPGWLRKPDLIDIAFAIEDTHKLNPGELPAAVEFMQRSEFQSDSPLNENSLSSEVLQRDAPTPVLIRSRFFILKILMLLCVLFSITLFAGTDSLVAVTRIGNPQSRQKWPQMTELEVFNQSLERISTGSIVSLVGRESSQFYVMDQRGEPPEDVILEVRRKSQPLKRIRLHGTSETISGIKTKTVFGFRLIPNPNESLQFRVVGGDDDAMPWTTLLRELKPAVQTLSCQITPPQYLELESRLVQNWMGAMQVPAGATLKFDLKLNRPVELLQIRDQAESVILEQDIRSDAYSFPLEIDADADDILNYEVRVKINGNNNSSDWTRIKRLQIEPIPDQLPRVTLSQPANDLHVTREAILPLKANATDDYGLQSLRIVIVSGEEYSFPASEPLKDRISDIQAQLEIALIQVKIDETIEVHAEVSDFNPLAEPVLTPVVKLHVVSQSEKESQLIQGVKKIVNELAQGLIHQREIHASSNELFLKFKEAGFLRSERDRIDFVEIQQSQLNQRFQESVIKDQVNSLIGDFQLNKVQNNDISNGLQLIQSSCQNEIAPRLRAGLDSLRNLRSTLQAGETKTASGKTNSAVDILFQQLILKQTASIEAMSNLLSQLTQWTDASDVQVQWQLLQSELRRLTEELNAMAQQTVSKSWQDLTKPQQQSLLEASKKHQHLGTRVATLIQQSAQLDNTVWKRLGTLLKESFVEAELQRAAVALKQNNVLKVVGIDQKLIRLFEEFDRELSSQAVSQATEYIEQLKALKNDLNDLVAEQSLLNEKWIEETRKAELETPQENIRRELQQLSETISSFGMRQASAFFETYSSRVEDLLTAEPDIKREQLEQNVTAVSHSLEQMQQLLDASLNRLLKRDQIQLLTELAELAKSMIDQQQSVINRFAAIQQSSAEKARLTRSQRRELLKLGENERQIAVAMQPFTTNLPEDHPASPSLLAIVDLTTELASQFERGNIESQQVDKLDQVLAHLKKLSQDSQETQPAEINAQIPQKIRDRLEKLLVQHADLTRRAKKRLEEQEELTSEENQKFQEEQAEIDTRLNELFEELLPTHQE